MTRGSGSSDPMLQILQMLVADREAERAERQANLSTLQQIADTSKTYLLSRTLLLLFLLYLVCFWMKLTRTNVVFSRIVLVSCLCAETQLSGNHEVIL